MNASRVISKLRGLTAGPDVVIDLGTANTRLYAMGGGLVVHSPTMLFNSSSGRGGDAQSGFKAPSEGGERVPAWHERVDRRGDLS